FGGRAVNAVDGRPLNFCAGAPDDDVDGHGTHTASIAAGRAYGVAKGAAIVALKAFGPGCRGPSPVVDALDSVIRNGGQPGVVNRSWGSFGGDIVPAKVLDAVHAGFPVVLSAACSSNTKRTWGAAAGRQKDGVFIAGSLARDDVAPRSIDYGKALTLFAPAI